MFNEATDSIFKVNKVEEKTQENALSFLLPAFTNGTSSIKQCFEYLLNNLDKGANHS